MTSESDSQPERAPLHRSKPFLALTGSGTAVAIVAALLNLRTSQPALLADVFALAAVASVLLLNHRGPLSRWMPWIAAGALLGASVIGALTIAPYTLLAAGLFATAGMVDKGTPRPRLRARLAIGLLAGVVNGALLWLLVFSEHRPFPTPGYLAKDLRAHTLLADVPLHDVWVAHLLGGPEELDMLDVREMLVDGFRNNRNTGFLAAAAVRGVLGSIFGWDEDHCRDPEASFVHRLTDADRRRSVAPPEDRLFLYTFEGESAIEIINCTVHAFVVAALEPAEGGYSLYWAFYVKPIGGITSFYMALIQPFRISIIYPSILEGIEREWADRWDR